MNLFLTDELTPWFSKYACGRHLSSVSSCHRILHSHMHYFTLHIFRELQFCTRPCARCLGHICERHRPHFLPPRIHCVFNEGTIDILSQTVPHCVGLSCSLQAVQHPWPGPNKFPSRMPIMPAHISICLQRALLSLVENHCREDRFGTSRSLNAFPIAWVWF